MSINNLKRTTKRNKYLQSKEDCKARIKKREKEENREANNIDICDKRVKKLRKLC